MQTITAEDVETAVRERSIKSWKLRECGLCKTPLYYTFEDGKVFFNPNCECITCEAPPMMRTYDDVAKCFNIQRKLEVQTRMWEDFLNSGDQHES